MEEQRDGETKAIEASRFDVMLREREIPFWNSPRAQMLEARLGSS